MKQSRSGTNGTTTTTITTGKILKDDKGSFKWVHHICATNDCQCLSQRWVIKRFHIIFDLFRIFVSLIPFSIVLIYRFSGRKECDKNRFTHCFFFIGWPLTSKHSTLLAQRYQTTTLITNSADNFILWPKFVPFRREPKKWRKKRTEREFSQTKGSCISLLREFMIQKIGIIVFRLFRCDYFKLHPCKNNANAYCTALLKRTIITITAVIGSEN